MECEAVGFNDAVVLFNRLQEHLTEHSQDPSAWAVQAKHARSVIVDEVRKYRFLHISKDRSGYLDQDALLGQRVKDAFPSATFDIREAGNCMAAECNTGAVFHLMRTVEWGLRALCVDMGFRKLRTQNKKTGKVKYIPLGWVEWETILNQLKERVTKRVASTKRGPKKQLYQEFYYPALQDIEAIKDAWRNHVMHTRREYMRGDADSAFSHVKRLMVNLAARVSQC